MDTIMPYVMAVLIDSTLLERQFGKKCQNSK